MAYALDTHAAIQNLTAAGIKQAHAEAIVAIVVRSKTKTAEGDVPLLRAHLDAAAARLEAKIAAKEQRTLLVGLAIAALLFASLRLFG